jgi:glycosyltransferase involved in cell wall biosynthesis
MLNDKIKNLFSAAIIAKNEEANIEKCIKSINKICSNVVVVDTGSDDKTSVIASKLGANVFFHKWNNDFSLARNYALKYIYSDWIISIDADEEVVLESFENEIEKIFNDNDMTKIGGISVILNNFLDTNLQTSKQHRFTRIFRNNKNIFFQGKIHEQISDSITTIGFDIIDSEIIFNHYGYIGKNEQKELRNKELLESSLEQNENDDYLSYHLAHTEFSIGNFDKAMELFWKLKNSIQLSDLQIEEVRLKIGQILLKRDKFEEAINELDFRAKSVDNEGLRLSVVGAANLSLLRFQEAKKIYDAPEISLSNLVDKNMLQNVSKIFEHFNIR